MNQGVVYICDLCVSPYYTYNRGSLWCKGCQNKCCPRCAHHKRFSFNGEDRCENCFVRPNVYFCTQCPKGTCASQRCTRISNSFWLDDIEAELPVRGYCCIAQGWQHLDDICRECVRFRVVSVTITLLGIRKYRPESHFSAIHKDVLSNLLIKQYLLPQERAWFAESFNKKQRK